MNNYFYINLFLCIFTLESTYTQEVTSLRSLALDKTAQELHTQLIKLRSLKDRLSLIKKWETKSSLVMPKNDTAEKTILEQFEQKYSSKLKEFKAFTGNIKAITSDNTKVITYNKNDESTLAVCDMQTGNTIHILNGHLNKINKVKISSDNSKAISSSDDNSLVLWNLNTGKAIHNLEGHSRLILDFAFTPDNSKAISSSNDGTLILWDLNNGNPVQTLKPTVQVFPDPEVPIVANVLLTLNNDKAICGMNWGTLIFWDFNTGKFVQTVEGHKNKITHIFMLPDNKAISTSANNTHILWDLNSGKPLDTYTLKNSIRALLPVTLTSDNNKAISANPHSGSFTLWDLTSCKRIHTFMGHHTEPITNVIPILDDTKAVSSSDDYSLILWDLKTAKALDQISSNSPSVQIYKNLLASGNKLFKLEDWQSIILNMPQLPKKIISAPHNLLDDKHTGPLAGLYKARLLKQKIQPSLTAQAPTNSMKQKIFALVGYLKNKIVNAYKRLS